MNLPVTPKKKTITSPLYNILQEESNTFVCAHPNAPNCKHSFKKIDGTDTVNTSNVKRHMKSHENTSNTIENFLMTPKQKEEIFDAYVDVIAYDLRYFIFK
jgi:hypothetical protein